MAASTIEPEHNRTAGPDRPHSTKQHRRRLLSHLHVQVPVPTSSGWSDRPSGPASAPCDAHAAAHHHQDQPALPLSLLRSPTAWIRSKGHSHSFGSSKHTPRRPGNFNFHYDARSYAQNFDEGGRDREEEDALKQHRYLSLGLLATSPRQVWPSSPSCQGISGGGGSSDGEEPAREILRGME